MPLLLPFPPSWRFLPTLSPFSKFLTSPLTDYTSFLGASPFRPIPTPPAPLLGPSSFYPDSHPFPRPPRASSFLPDSHPLLRTTWVPPLSFWIPAPLPRAPWREYLFLLFRLQDTSVFRKPPSRFFDDSCSPKFGQGAKSCLPKMRSVSATSRRYSRSRPER